MSISDEQFEQLLGQLDDIQPDDAHAYFCRLDV